LEILDEHDSSAFGRTGLMVSPVTLGKMEFWSKVDEAEAGKLFRAGARRARAQTTTRIMKIR
jgi:hypothetical protein